MSYFVRSRRTEGARRDLAGIGVARTVHAPARMKVAWVVVLVACSSKVATTYTGEDASPIGPCGALPEALPPPHCGQGSCSCCAGCGLADGLCLGDPSTLSFGIGQCLATPAAGEVTASAFASDSVAAAVAGAYVEVSARTATRTLVLALPATPGTYACSDPGTAMQMILFDGGTRHDNTPGAGRPPCTVTVTAVGAIGQRAEGAFDVTFTGGVELAGGAFSVERVAYP